MPTPSARDGKGPGHQYGLPDLIEGHGITGAPTMPATPTSGGGTGYLSGNCRDTWRPTLELAVQGHQPSRTGRADSTAALLPTPTASAYGSNQSTSAGTAVRPGLARLAAGGLLPTPRASDTSTPGRDAGAGFRPPLPQVVLPLVPTPTVADSHSSANATAGRTTPMVGHAGRTLTDAASLLPTPRATDGFKGCPAQRRSHGDLTLPSAAVAMLPTPTVSDARGPAPRGDGGPNLRTTATTFTPVSDTQRRGAYADAVARWEHLLGRPAPEPTQPGRHGRPVLAPPFVEWLMGLEPGWVTRPGAGPAPHHGAAGARQRCHAPAGGGGVSAAAVPPPGGR